jgi:hypothetical protein
MLGMTGLAMGCIGVASAFCALFYSVSISGKTPEQHKGLISRIDKMESRLLSAIKATKTKTAKPQPARKTKPRKSGKKSK